MTPERWRRLQELFDGALDREPGQREAYLDQACTGDPALRRQVDSLLLHSDQTGGLSALVEAAIEEEAEPVRVDRVGPYRIEEEIGRGGMGTVYRGVRDDDAYQGRVAVKVLRARSWDGELARRFRAERQILANLHHPGIASLLDGGTTSHGAPYLVMEYVEGVPITAHCDAFRLPTPDRLRLFREVCAAVQYAHQNLIVHRDLKPGNILVTPEGRPKLLDFGIAKLLTTGPDTPAARTEAHLRLMTPEYASPEQVRGDPITTASDVYSLGVLLYELLAGRRPYRVSTTRPAEMERQILEMDPPAPSTAVKRSDAVIGADGRPLQISPENVAAARSTRPALLRRQLSGDLDNIVLKALRKDPAQRYASAAELGEDVRRALDGLPVAARPATLRYRTGKFVQRHRGAVGTAAVFALLLVGAAFWLVAERHRAVQAEADARREAETARQTTRFLVDVFRVSDPSESRGNTVTAREILDEGAERIATELAGQPVVQAELMETMGTVYRFLGLRDRAQPLLEQSYALRRIHMGEDTLATAAAMAALGELLREKADYKTAEQLHTRALQIRRERAGEDSVVTAESYNNLGLTLRQDGRLAEAEPLLRRALEIRREALGDLHPDVGVTLVNLGQLLRDRGDQAAALPLFREVAAVRQQTLGDDHPRTINARAMLAMVIGSAGQLDEAETISRDVLERRRRVLGPQHPDTLNAVNEVASRLHDKGAWDEAEALYREALSAQIADGESDMDDAVSLNNLATLLEDRGQEAEAEDLFRRSLAVRRARLGEDHPAVARAMHNLGRLLVTRGRMREGRQLLVDALERRRRRLGDDHPDVASSLYALAEASLGQRALDDARTLATRAVEIRRARLSVGHPQIGAALTLLGRIDTARGDLATAEAALREATGMLEARLDAGHRQVAEARLALGACLLAQDRTGEAEPLLASSHASLVTRLGADHPLAREASARVRKGRRTVRAAH